jgi:hypothetical protein
LEETAVRLKTLLPAFVIATSLSLAPFVARAQTPASGGPTASPANAEVYFINIKDGDKLPRTFSVQFGLRNMGLAPAGTDRPNSGHHHLIIDSELPPMNEPIPSDFNHLHFGAGQSEATVTLPPGQHKLQLLLGDANHVPHSPPVMSKVVTITVDDAASSNASAPASTEDAKRNDAKREQAEREKKQRREEAKREEREDARREELRRERKAKQEQDMRRAKAAAGGGGGAAIVRGAGRKEWCQIQALNRTCGFTSYEQCRASVAGVGGSCIER